MGHFGHFLHAGLSLTSRTVLDGARTSLPSPPPPPRMLAVPVWLLGDRPAMVVVATTIAPTTRTPHTTTKVALLKQPPAAGGVAPLCRCEPAMGTAVATRTQARTTHK